MALGDAESCTACGHRFPAVAKPVDSPRPAESKPTVRPTTRSVAPQTSALPVTEIADDFDFDFGSDVHYVEGGHLGDDMISDLDDVTPLEQSRVPVDPGYGRSQRFEDPVETAYREQELDDDDFALAPQIELQAYATTDRAADEYQMAPPPAAPTDVPPVQPSVVQPPPVQEASAEAPPVQADAAARSAAETPHSVATAGDVLFDAALAEEAEARKRLGAGRRKIRRTQAITATPGVSLVVFCPYGHRVLVLEKFRGRTGRCPNCKNPFFVPTTPLVDAAAVAEPPPTAATAGSAGGAADGKYNRWILDARLHRVNPMRLKIKEDSLLGEYDTVDLAFCPDHMLCAVVFSGGGAFRAMNEQKKKPLARQALRDQITAAKPLGDIPGFKFYEVASDAAALVKVVQPTVPGEESMFADVPVFGVGRIAIRFPVADSGVERAFLSFSLSQFREFSLALEEGLGVAGLGTNAPIPLIDETTEFVCHFSEVRFPALEKLEFYRADSSFKLELLGWRCQSCGIVVSENSRKKERIGGKNESSVAKAKCPKCKQRFGNQPLYGMTADPRAAAAASPPQ